MNKKILAIAIVACLLVGLGAGLTAAYFFDKDEAHNTFTVGNVKIELTEPGWEASGKIDAPEVYPGEPLAKDPTVTNIGANPCLVRIEVDWPDDMDLKYRTNYQEGQLGEGWTDGEDGYFYYLKPLAPGDKTSALFDQIVIPTSLTNGDAETEYDIVVTAYAVQAQGIFPSYSTIADGIDVDKELPTVIQFFENVFPPTT